MRITLESNPSDAPCCLKSMETGMKNVACRMVAAENNFVEVLMNFGEISKADAEKVLVVYRKLKLVKMDAVNGVMSVKHGAYLDKATIANAMSYAHRSNP